MANQVEFNYAAWIARYPEFTAVTEPTALGYFNEAVIYHRNDGTGPVTDDTVQLALLNMVVAHIAARYAIINGVSPSPLVGRITNATEGSVSVTVGGFASVQPATMEWWLQTKPGSDYWFATAPYRVFNYRPGPRRVFDQVFPPVIVVNR